jgi:hypothetical protein
MTDVVVVADVSVAVGVGSATSTGRDCFSGRAVDTPCGVDSGDDDGDGGGGG